MIQSMTAYGRKAGQGDWGNASCEIRSVNHRFLEMNFRLPEALRELEIAMRDMIRSQLGRGKVDCNFRFEAGLAGDKPLSVNMPLVQSLLKAHDDIANQAASHASLQLTSIMKWPGVISSQETDINELKPAILSLLQAALEDVVAVRSREGAALKDLIEQRLSSMEQHIADIAKVLPEVAEAARERLIKKFNEAKVELDPTRLEQEMLIFAQKSDVAEEIDRLHTHIKEVRRVLVKGGQVGRRLDFLMQELNREANTLSSKSQDTRLTQGAVELKVLIEQMREQVQNIE